MTDTCLRSSESSTRRANCARRPPDSHHGLWSDRQEGIESRTGRTRELGGPPELPRDPAQVTVPTTWYTPDRERLERNDWP